MIGNDREPLLPKHLALDAEHDPAGTRASVWLEPTRRDLYANSASTLSSALAVAQQQANQLQAASLSSSAFFGGSGMGQLGGLFGR